MTTTPQTPPSFGSEGEEPEEKERFCRGGCDRTLPLEEFRVNRVSKVSGIVWRKHVCKECEVKQNTERERERKYNSRFYVARRFPGLNDTRLKESQERTPGREEGKKGG